MRTTRAFDAKTGRIDSITSEDVLERQVQTLTYECDLVGNLTTRTEGSVGKDLTETFTYDTLNRLSLSAINAIFRSMKLMPSHLARIFILVLMFSTVTSCQTLTEAERAFQNDADLARLEHLEYWTGLVEEYQKATGQFPFTSALASQESIGLVRIANANQLKYFDPGSSQYVAEFDNNYDGMFQEFSVADFVEELERGLGRTIDEKYDIQYVPTSSPVWYFYFVTKSGYLMWVTCITCGVTQISTLLLDGYTPTVNIASAGMKDSVTKALTRQEMLSHAIFRRWKSKQFVKEQFVRDREQKHYNDSKVHR